MSSETDMARPSAPTITSTSDSWMKSPDFLGVYLRRFVNRLSPVMRRGYAGGWRKSDERLTAPLLEQAVNGLTTLGLYSVSQQGLSKWCCLDVDTEDGYIPLLRLIDNMEESYHLLFEMSRRGFHLWAFFRPPIPWQEARAYGLELAERAGIQCEVFPKGEGLNGVRAPLSRHPKTGKTYPLIDPKTALPEDNPRRLIITLTPIVLDLPLERFRPQLAKQDPSAGLALPAEGDHRALVEEVSRYTQLKPIGPERLHGPCPFHRPDKNPSFGITGGYWQCFAECLGKGNSHGGLNAFRARIRGR